MTYCQTSEKKSYCEFVATRLDLKLTCNAVIIAIFIQIKIVNALHSMTFTDETQIKHCLRTDEWRVKDNTTRLLPLVH